MRPSSRGSDEPPCSRQTSQRCRTSSAAAPESVLGAALALTPWSVGWPSASSPLDSRRDNDIALVRPGAGDDQLVKVPSTVSRVRAKRVRTSSSRANGTRVSRTTFARVTPSASTFTAGRQNTA